MLPAIALIRLLQTKIYPCNPWRRRLDNDALEEEDLMMMPTDAFASSADSIIFVEDDDWQKLLSGFKRHVQTCEMPDWSLKIWTNDNYFGD